MHLHLVAMFQSTPNPPMLLPSSASWEIIKGVMLTLTTAGVLGSVKMLLALNKQVVRHDSLLVGVDGKNGLVGKVANLSYRVDNIEERHSNLDAAAAAIAKLEKEQMPDGERRHKPRRLRDRLNPLEKTDEEEGV